MRKINPVIYEMIAYVNHRRGLIPEEWKHRLSYEPSEDAYVDNEHPHMAIYDELEDFLEAQMETRPPSPVEMKADNGEETDVETEEVKHCLLCKRLVKWGEYQYCNKCGTEICNACMEGEGFGNMAKCKCVGNV